MSGSPSRFTRDQLGPTLVDQYPVQNPESQIPGAAHNTVFHATAGMNLVAPRVALLARWNGSSFTYEHQAESWNSKNDQLHPDLARAAAGEYSYTFAATYNDENGTAQAIALLRARLETELELAAFADRLISKAWVDSGDPLVVQLRIWDASGVATDAPFWLEVF